MKSHKDGEAIDQTVIGSPSGAEDTEVETARDVYEGGQSVKRGIKARHFKLMAFGSAVGTGLFLAIGEALSRGGPLSVFLSYTLTSMAVYGTMQCLGEMGTWMPVTGAIPLYCSRFVDDALGFAVGWNVWYANSMVVCTEASAAAIVIQYWTTTVNPAVWITIVIIVVILLNIIAVSIFGEAEFIFSIVKLTTMIGLLILSLVIDLGGAPAQDRLGFRYWMVPGAMNEYIGTGAAGRFAGWFATVIAAGFAFGGSEGIIAAAGEAKDPRKNIPTAIRIIFFRILVFYVLGSLAVGLIVPYNDPRLLSGGAGAAASPWVIGIVNAGIPVLPSILNAVILISAISVANNMLFNASRYLYSLAQCGQAPRFLLRCSSRGIPYFAVGITSSMTLLTYMTVSSGTNKAFLWFMNITTFSSFLTWMTIALSYIRFRAAIKAQGIGIRALPYRTPFQPYAAYFSLVYFSFVALGNGFAVFTDGNWSTSDFIAAYIGLPIYIFLFAFWKIFKRTKLVRASSADLSFPGQTTVHDGLNLENVGTGYSESLKPT
ncbi:hypothetical protein N7489_002321 [Penicillium chrysogenum]|uniref:uncharacterized protein n=1 Tax=Penicillium chrysogenum TaxID=5076 RepID=UPI0024DF1F95|nr:uncharacterized protein N7489_002321 [Penicillium chrysogenum]KAJ5251911.1 hypothetical protein N7489_002321 [Penicillium chrysogenum]